jgi:hypothetical protein
VTLYWARRVRELQVSSEPLEEPLDSATDLNRCDEIAVHGCCGFAGVTILIKRELKRKL